MNIRLRRWCLLKLNLSSKPNVDVSIPSQSGGLGRGNELQHDHYAQPHETSAQLWPLGRLYTGRK